MLESILIPKVYVPIICLLIEIRVHPKSIVKFKDKIREIASRSNAMSMETRYIKLKQVIVGWVNYFKIANMGKIAQKLDEWIRRRIRMCY